MNPDDTVNLNAAKSTHIAEGPPSGVSAARPAFCPKCSGAMAANEPACPHCGYNFPFGAVDRGPGWAFSFFADVVLIIAAALASFGCMAAMTGAIVALMAGQPGASLFLLMCGFLLLALAIVFLRVQRLEPRGSSRRR